MQSPEDVRNQGFILRTMGSHWREDWAIRFVFWKIPLVVVYKLDTCVGVGRGG